MTRGRFRILVAATAVFYVWWMTLPQRWDGLPHKTIELLQQSGANAILTPEHWASAWAYYLFNALLLAAGAGLMLLQRWGRTLLLVHTAFGIAMTLFTGANVSLPFDAFIGSTATTLAAVVLGIAYTQPISGLLSGGQPKREAHIEQTSTSEPRDVTLVPVLETGDATQLEVVKAWLTAAGIEHVVENDTAQDFIAAGRLGGHNFALGASRILVAQEDAEAARLLANDAATEQARPETGGA